MRGTKSDPTSGPLPRLCAGHGGVLRPACRDEFAPGGGCDPMRLAAVSLPPRPPRTRPKGPRKTYWGMLTAFWKLDEKWRPNQGKKQKVISYQTREAKPRPKMVTKPGKRKGEKGRFALGKRDSHGT